METRLNRGQSIGALSVFSYAFLVLFLFLTMFPILWGVATSLKPAEEIISYPPTIIPSRIVFESYGRVLFRSNFITYFLNSILMTALSVSLSVAVAAHGAYALARFKLPHRNLLMFFLLVLGMVPQVSLLIPLYMISVAAGLYNTRILIILIYTTWRTPVLTWILYGFFRQAPLEIEEAAIVDGCTKSMTFYRITLPICQSGIISAALVSAVFIWNDFLVAFTFTTQSRLRMIAVGLYNYVTQYGIRWGELMAAVVVSIVPIIILFFGLQKRFVSGLAAGAVKG